jgi:hypothetical protein
VLESHKIYNETKRRSWLGHDDKITHLIKLNRQKPIMLQSEKNEFLRKKASFFRKQIIMILLAQTKKFERKLK